VRQSPSLRCRTSSSIPSAAAHLLLREGAGRRGTLDGVCGLCDLRSGQIMERPDELGPGDAAWSACSHRGGHTGVDKLFCGGDCVQGPSVHRRRRRLGASRCSVDSRVPGEDMEAAGDRIYQNGRGCEPTTTVSPSSSARVEPGISRPRSATTMTEVEQSWSDRRRSSRPFAASSGDSVHHYDPERLRVLCGACDDVCPEKAIDVVVFGEDRERSSGGETLVCRDLGRPARCGWLRGRDLHQLRSLHQLQDLRRPLSR